MKLKFLHLNTLGGHRIDDVITYIKTHNFDIIQLQEVGGKGQSHSVSDNFAYYKEKLGYKGELAISFTYKNDFDSYQGNATFFRPEFSYTTKEIIWLKPFIEIDATFHTDRAKTKLLPRNALALKFIFNSQPIWFVNTHLAWGPTPEDEQYKIDQGKILHNFLAKLKDPFVLSGDFNVVSDSEIVKMISELGIDHATKAGITNTLNAHLHRASELFPKGLAVDYLFTSFNLNTSDFALVDQPDLSDHYGLRISIETNY